MGRAAIALTGLQNLTFKIALPVCFLLLLVVGSIADAQSPDAVADLAARINRERVSRGLVPYALNAQLTAAAQAHANDIANTGKYSHVGSDGSTVFDRVARTGYGAYSWGRRLGENWAWYQNAATAMEQWMDSAPHRDNILHPLYREIGIGIAPGKFGNTVFVIDFGAEPNVLPAFINEGASETRALTVILTLSSEEVMPNGDGEGNVGRATQVQISNSPDLSGAQWQPFAQHIEWTLAPGGGSKTVYVKYRDAKGRTATASDTITYRAAATPTPLPTPTRTRTPRPTATATHAPTPTLTPTAAPTETATETPTYTATPSQAPTRTVEPDTPTPLPSSTSAAAPAQIAQEMNLAALGTFGIAVMLSVLAVVTYLARRG